MFVPIGSYYVIEDDRINVLDTSDVSSQVQDVILSHPLSNMESIEEIRNGHSMPKYLDSVMNINKLGPLGQPGSVKEETFFEPKVDGEGKVLWEKQDNGDWECQLIARGKFLGPLHLSSERNVFTGTPFRNTSKSNWVRKSSSQNRA